MTESKLGQKTVGLHSLVRKAVQLFGVPADHGMQPSIPEKNRNLLVNLWLEGAFDLQKNEQVCIQDKGILKFKNIPPDKIKAIVKLIRQTYLCEIHHEGNYIIIYPENELVNVINSLYLRQQNKACDVKNYSGDNKQVMPIPRPG